MNSQDNSGKYIDFFTVKLLTSDEGLYKSEFVLDSKGELNNEKIRYFLANIFKSRKRGN